MNQAKKGLCAAGTSGALLSLMMLAVGLGACGQNDGPETPGAEAPGAEAPGAETPSAETPATGELGAWLSTPQKAEIQYTFDQNGTWVGVTLLRMGEREVPIEFMFQAPDIAEERLALFKAGKTKFTVEFDPSQLRFQRASADPKQQLEEFNVRNIDAWALSGSSLATTCGDRIAQSNHGRATIDGKSADYTLQVRHPYPADTRNAQGIAIGNTTGCLWDSSNSDGSIYMYTCPSGQTCPREWPCTVKQWTWVTGSACVSGSYGSDGGSGSGSACGRWTQTTISSPVSVV
ncbi:MAG TPA: hypothetical protein VE153_34410, partial [Myxococcus sp.]|nr:hypothetical protein [Myxococcus sp.]